MKKQILLILYFSVTPFIFLYSQVDTLTNETMDDALNILLDESSEETDNSAIYDMLEELKQNPIDINTAQVSDLEKIPTLDISIAKLIIAHRKKFGNFFSKNEILTIKGLPEETAKLILPFIKVNSSANRKISGSNFLNNSKDIFNKSNIILRSRVIRDIQKTQNYSDNNYAGSPYKTYNKFIFRSGNNYQLGFLAEKDPGEKYINDYSSFHLFIKKFGPIEHFVAGDYLLKFGQGLVLWNSYGFSKGSDAVYPVKKIADGVQPYTSTDENKFFRGAAAALNWNKLKLTTFFSSKKIDAQIDSLTGYIISTPITGYHRTSAEISKKNAAQEKLYGCNLTYNATSNLQAGFLYYHSSFSNPFISKEIYDIKGSKFNYYSLSVDLFFNNINLFGEMAYDNISVASFTGVQFIINHNFIFTTSIRSYPRNFINLHGFGFGERSGKTQDEFGIYNGIKWNTFLGTINFYYDQFHFPYPSSTNLLPSEGEELLFNMTSKPAKNIETRFRYKYENKEISGEVNSLKTMVERLRQSFRGELIFNFTSSLRLKERLEYNNYNLLSESLHEKGVELLHELRIRTSKNLSFYGEIIFFKTDSFNSAMYTYENDLTGILSNVVLYGEGLRWFGLIKYKIFTRLALSIKYSETIKLGNQTNEISKETLDNRLGIQIDMNI